jgi:hypothetical protein
LRSAGPGTRTPPRPARTVRPRAPRLGGALPSPTRTSISRTLTASLWAVSRSSAATSKALTRKTAQQLGRKKGAAGDGRGRGTWRDHVSREALVAMHVNSRASRHGPMRMKMKKRPRGRRAGQNGARACPTPHWPSPTWKAGKGGRLEGGCALGSPFPRRPNHALTGRASSSSSWRSRPCTRDPEASGLDSRLKSSAQTAGPCAKSFYGSPQRRAPLS